MILLFLPLYVEVTYRHAHVHNHTPPHTCTCTHTTPHSTMTEGLRVALRIGSDKGCVFLLVFLLCFQSGLGVASKQTGLLGLAVHFSGLLDHWLSSRWRCVPRGPGPGPFVPAKAGVTGKAGSGSARIPAELWPWQTHRMTHRLDEGLCQKQRDLASWHHGK